MVSAAPYNPFEPVTAQLLKNIIREGYDFIVLQRFSWPGLDRSTSFIATVYESEQEAKVHELELLPNEGRLLHIPADAQKLSAIINNPAYKVFINTFKDQVWKMRTLKAYKNSIVAFLRAQNFKTKDPIDIELKFEWGRLLAVIQSGERSLQVSAYELIR